MSETIGKSLDVWGGVNIQVENSSEIPKEFCDSFNPFSNEERSTNYIPLDDSAEYLSNLERKLSRVQGKTSTKRSKESKRLIDALVMSRSLHNNSLIQSAENNDIESSFENYIDSQERDGFAAVSQWFTAPQRRPISEEELYCLLKEDLLSKIHEEANKNEDSLSR